MGNRVGLCGGVCEDHQPPAHSELRLVVVVRFVTAAVALGRPPTSIPYLPRRVYTVVHTIQFFPRLRQPLFRLPRRRTLRDSALSLLARVAFKVGVELPATLEPCFEALVALKNLHALVCIAS